MTRRHAWVQSLRNVADQRLLLLLLACLGAVIALARPQMVREGEVFRYLFVLDITMSMNVRDVAYQDRAVSRLELAKMAVGHSLAELPCGSEAGIGLFTERRALVLFAPVEVCRHYAGVTGVLERIDGRLAWRARSEIARGLRSSLSATAALGDSTRLVFLSDGHEAPPVHPDYRARLTQEGDPVHGLIVGIGGDALVPIPVVDDDAQVVGVWAPDEVQQVDSYRLGRSTGQEFEGLVGVDSSDLAARIARGTEHLSSLRGEYLQQLAREAGFEYVRAAAPADLARELTRTQYANRKARAVGLHWLAALPAAACVLGVALTGRRHRRTRE